jgi:hypothetical protein
VSRPVSMWPCMDTDSVPYEDRPLSKLKESDRCSASENLYLDALSLDEEPEEPEEPPPCRPERDLRNCLLEVSLGCVHFSRPLQVPVAAWELSENEIFSLLRVLLSGPDPNLPSYVICAQFNFATLF